MLQTYDTAILGCGEAGVFAGYELVRRNPGMQVLIVDQGQDIYHRSCPIVHGRVKECAQCRVCHTMCGFGGAGAFSDGKYNFTTAFGGWLTDFMPQEEVMELIDYVDEINTAHGATREVFSTDTPAARALRKKALEYDLHLLQARVKHLGTENNLRILTNIYESLRDKITFRFNTAVTAIRQAQGGYLLETADGDQFLSKYLIAAPGRSGAEWFAGQCRALGLPFSLCAFVLFQCFPRQITSIFGAGDPLYFDFAASYLRIYMFMVCLFGIQPLSVDFFTSIGAVKQGIFLSVSRQGFLLLPLLIILPLFLGLDGVLYAGPIADFLAVVLSVSMIKRSFQRLDRLAAEQEANPE